MSKKQEDFLEQRKNGCSTASENFDFEKWSTLAETNNEQFEEERRLYIHAYIQSCPEDQHHRLWQLQWKIDAIRKTSSNPLASCIRLYEMLLDQVYGAGGLLDNLMVLGGQKSSCDICEGRRNKAKILQFNQRMRC